MNTSFTDLNAPLLRGQQSDIGKRPNQEDRWEIRDFKTADGRPATLAMVADGIGGHSSGEMASQMAKTMIPSLLLANPPSASEITRRLKSVLEEVGRAIYNASLEDPNRSGMGTTCTAIVVADRRLHLAHVGDSRAYLLRGGQLRQLTIDHTWAEEAIRAGRSPDEIRTHPNRGVIMRYLGIDPSINIDTRYRSPSGEIVDILQSGPLFLDPGDTLMLSSDGVSDTLDARLVAEFVAYPDCQVAADALVSSALKAGATDNVTAVVLRVPGAAAVAPPAAAGSTRKLPVLPIALAALALVAVGAVAGLALSGRNRAQPVATAAVVSQAPSATQVVPKTPRPTATGGGVQVAPAVVTPATATPTTLPPVPVPAIITETLGITSTNPITTTGSLTTTLPGSGEPTVIPTRTVTPTRMPDTSAPRPSQTPRSSATAPTQQGSGLDVDLIKPGDGEKIIGGAEFEWQNRPGFFLKRDERYELIIWGSGEKPLSDGRSPVGAGVETKVSANLTGVESPLGLSPGETYFWGVRLVTTKGAKVRMLSDERKFVYDRSSPGSDGSNVSDPGCTGPLCP